MAAAIVPPFSFVLLCSIGDVNAGPEHGDDRSAGCARKTIAVFSDGGRQPCDHIAEERAGQHVTQKMNVEGDHRQIEGGDHG